VIKPPLASLDAASEINARKFCTQHQTRTAGVEMQREMVQTEELRFIACQQ